MRNFGVFDYARGRIRLELGLGFVVWGLVFWVLGFVVLGCGLWVGVGVV